MDKIREEFEKYKDSCMSRAAAENISTVYISKCAFEAGYKSRDEEIKKWKENYMKLYEWIIARDLLGEYLEDFYEALKETI